MKIINQIKDILLNKILLKMETDRFSYQQKYITFDIKKGEKVLDIGSGGDPFPYATHLADLYEGDTVHRSISLKKDNRPFQVCNIESTPYIDKEFDFVYCSHVLEHVDNPAKACKELMRIAKRGYIETPTKTSDIMFNFTKIPNHHKWYIEVLNNTLIFMEWDAKKQRDLGTSYFFRKFHYRFSNPFQKLVRNNRDIFVNMLLWKDQFNYIVISAKGEIIASSIDMNFYSMKPEPKKQ